MIRGDIGAISAMSAFPNQYQTRMVAEKDSKACTLCFKPSTTVLISQNKVDFFYVCPLHLKDEHFCRPVHPDEYKELETKRDELETKIGRTRKRVEELKPYAWNILASMGSKAEPDKAKDAGDNQDKPKETHESAKQEVRKLEGELVEINAGISNYKFKEYILDKDIYRMRTQGHAQTKIRAKKQQEMHKPGYFPSAPLHKIGE